MTKERESRIAYRGEDGRLITEARAKRMNPRDYTREHLPLPGHGDTNRGKTKKR